MKGPMLSLVPLLLVAGLAQASNCNLSAPEEFGKFFEQFSADKEFATSRKIYPYPVQYLQYGIGPGEDEPTPVRSLVQKGKDAQYPALGAYMKEKGLTSEIQELKAQSAVVKIFKPDTDWQYRYFFLRKGNCWYMTEVQDDSL